METFYDVIFSTIYTRGYYNLLNASKLVAITISYGRNCIHRVKKLFIAKAFACD